MLLKKCCNLLVRDLQSMCRSLKKFYFNFYPKIGKRCFDIVATFFGLLLLLPIFLIIAIWLKLDSQGSIFFVQKRVGKNFKEFEIYKFRTMVMDAPKKGPAITGKDDNRITQTGKWLRKTKLDELPQLWNVLKGDMSLVGPRPEVIKFVVKEKQAYQKILMVKPGITDNAAIAFRYEEEIMSHYKDKEKGYIEVVLPQKIKLYNEYIENITFTKDITYILKTIKVL